MIEAELLPLTSPPSPRLRPCRRSTSPTRLASSKRRTCPAQVCLDPPPLKTAAKAVVPPAAERASEVLNWSCIGGIRTSSSFAVVNTKHLFTAVCSCAWLRYSPPDGWRRRRQHDVAAGLAAGLASTIVRPGSPPTTHSGNILQGHHHVLQQPGSARECHYSSNDSICSKSIQHTPLLRHPNLQAKAPH